LRRVQPLTQLTVALLEEEFRPGELTSERVAALLTPAIEGCDLVIKRDRE